MLEEGMNKSPTSKWAGEHSKFVMGESTPHATFAKVLKFNLRDGIAEKITCPTLVLLFIDIQAKAQPESVGGNLVSPEVNFSQEIRLYFSLRRPVPAT
jgi:hypothetical protein